MKKTFRPYEVTFQKGELPVLFLTKKGATNFIKKVASAKRDLKAGLIKRAVIRGRRVVVFK
jgi:hypothetical protein